MVNVFEKKCLDVYQDIMDSWKYEDKHNSCGYGWDKDYIKKDIQKIEDLNIRKVCMKFYFEDWGV